MRNKYAGACVGGGGHVPRFRGVLVRASSAQRWGLFHEQCNTADNGRGVSDVFTTSGGTFCRNKRGRCEDAPCCGCCTI